MPYILHRRGAPPVICDQSMTGSLVYSNLTIRAAAASRLSPDAAARRLADLYFSDLPRLSWGLFRARTRCDGQGEHTALHLALVPFLPFVLLGEPTTERTPSKTTVSYPITGGALTRPTPLGAFVFTAASADDGDLTLSVCVDGYASLLAGDCRSLWRRTLYRATQWFVHRYLVTRFLRHAARRLSISS